MGTVVAVGSIVVDVQVCVDDLPTEPGLAIGRDRLLALNFTQQSGEPASQSALGRLAHRMISFPNFIMGARRFTQPAQSWSTA